MASEVVQSRRSGYVTVGELEMYYDVQGSGPPLLLLHGGLVTTELSFGRVRAALAERYRTLAVEQQGHGRTGDIERALSYEQMVEDTAAVLRWLQPGRVDLFGWSDGGKVALGLAARHPELVRKVAIIGAGYNADAESPELKQFLASLKSDDEELRAFRESHAKVAKEPEKWPLLVRKVQAMWASSRGWSATEMKRLAAPLLILLGDRDFLPVEHALELFRLVPDARLGVLPGCDHSALDQHPEWITAMLFDFFEAASARDEAPLSEGDRDTLVVA
jgi:pimeloyl-ACP methyl ester carboxylesterase